MNDRTHIGLILEGTYPYLKGGVSVWTHELISGSPGYDFTIVALTDGPRTPHDYKFELPNNVKSVVTINLAQSTDKTNFLQPFRTHESVKPIAAGFLQLFQKLESDDFSGVAPLLRQIESSPLNADHLLNNSVFWDIISNLYANLGSDDSIARFFWVWEAMARSVVRLIRTPVPEADLYHCAATGYSGLMGGLAKHRYHKPLIVSEHGLYLQERQMEVAFHEILQGGQRKAVEVFFEWISRWSYHEADHVTSLGEFIRQHQISLGALPDRAHVIPNGIEVERYARVPRVPHEKFRVGLVGRVAPVKDIKLLIGAAAELLPSIPNLHVALIGPVEDPLYERECRELIHSLNLENVVIFEGFKESTQCYRDLDVLVVCSLKEVQPLTLLEAMASGVPMVATRSGGIPEMLSGIGQVFSPRDLGQLVKAIRRMHTDTRLRERMIAAGYERVKRYNFQNTLSQFHGLYEQVREKKAWPASV